MRSEILSIICGFRQWVVTECKDVLFLNDETNKGKKKIYKMLSFHQTKVLGGNLTWASEKGATEILFSTRIVAISPSRSPILPKTRTKCPFGYIDVDSQESMRTTTLKSCTRGGKETQMQHQEFSGAFRSTKQTRDKQHQSPKWVANFGIFVVVLVLLNCQMVYKYLAQCFEERYHLSISNKWAGNFSLLKKAKCDTF